MVIVVVDDEPDTRELARIVLERGGHEVHTARHPDEALQMLAQHSVDVVLTDLHMPRMDGQRLAACIADLHPEVTCIVWSTVAGRNDPTVRPKDVMQLRIEEWVDGGAHDGTDQQLAAESREQPAAEAGGNPDAEAGGGHATGEHGT